MVVVMNECQTHFAKPSPFNWIEWGGFGKVRKRFMYEH